MKVKSSKLYLVSSNNYFYYFTTLHMIAVNIYATFFHINFLFLSLYLVFSWKEKLQEWFHDTPMWILALVFTSSVSLGLYRLPLWY